MTGHRRIPDDELDFDANLFYTYHGEPFTGVAYEEHPTLGLSEVSYVDGLQSGWARHWYPDGTRKGEEEYSHNVRHGISREFDTKGRMTSESVYEYGIRVRTSEYSPDGRETAKTVLDMSSNLGRRLAELRAEYGWD